MERVGRKRSSPVPNGGQSSACPPNRKIQKMDQKEKERLHRLAAEESRRSFQLQPHVAGWPASLLASMTGGSAYDGKRPTGTPPFIYPSMTLVPSLSTPSRASLVPSNSTGSTPILPSPSLQSRPIHHQPPPPSTVKSHLNRSTDGGRPQSEDEAERQKDSSTPTQEMSYTPGGGSSSVYPCLYSPRHISSPFLYMYSHRSPISPMLFVGSPRAPPSIASIPSVESSSGCSSMSEGSLHHGGDTSRDDHGSGMRVAPDEYHVGVTIPPTDEPVSDDECVSSPSLNEDNDGSGENEVIDVVGSQPSLLLPPPPPPVLLSSGNPNLSSIGLSTTTEHRINGYENQAAYTNVIYHSSPANPLQNSSCVSSPSSSRGSTPEPTETNRDDPRGGAVEGGGGGGGDEADDVFCLVPGRLSLLSATQKYKVSLDEVRRRLSGPECLNASVLGGILRRAKSKNGGHHLRQRLEAKGLSLPAGRRKQTELFLLTSLVEGEAVHLAEDFKRLCENYFPHTELAQIIGAQHINSPHVERRISMVQAAQVLIQELQAMVDTVGGPNNLRPDDPCNPYPGLTNFSLLSHGFGNHNISSTLNIIQSYFNDLIRVYEGNKPNVMETGAQQTSGAVFNNGGATPTPPPSVFQAGGSGQPGRQSLKSKMMKREKKESIACNNVLK